MSPSDTTADKGVVADRFGEEAEAWERFYRGDRASTISLQNIVTRLEVVLEMLGSGPGRVLDVGSAAGAVSALLHDRGFEVMGVDISESMVRWAHRRIEREGRKRVAFAVADVDALPFPDAAFDALVAMGVIEYLDSDAKALDELVRVVKPGGRIIVTVPNLLSPFRWVDGALLAAERPFVPMLRRLRYGAAGAAERAKSDRPRLFHRDYTLGGLARELDRRGIAVDRLAGHSWGMYRVDPYLPFGAALTRATKGLSETPFFRSLGASLVVSGRKRAGS